MITRAFLLTFQLVEAVYVQMGTEISHVRFPPTTSARFSVTIKEIHGACQIWLMRDASVSFLQLRISRMLFNFMCLLVSGLWSYSKRKRVKGHDPQLRMSCAVRISISAEVIFAGIMHSFQKVSDIIFLQNFMPVTSQAMHFYQCPFSASLILSHPK